MRCVSISMSIDIDTDVHTIDKLYYIIYIIFPPRNNWLGMILFKRHWLWGINKSCTLELQT